VVGVARDLGGDREPGPVVAPGDDGALGVPPPAGVAVPAGEVQAQLGLVRDVLGAEAVRAADQRGWL
jgi:hypothetical protein